MFTTPPGSMKVKSRMANVPTGYIGSHGVVRSSQRLPFSQIIYPRLGIGAGCPIPRKLRNTSAPAMLPSDADTSTMIGPLTLGSRWRKSRQGVRHPMERAASTYCSSRACSTCPRTTRAMPNHENRANPKGTYCVTPWPSPTVLTTSLTAVNSPPGHVGSS